MAVYTDVSDEALTAFLGDYDIGALVAFRGIAEGVENSNFSLRTTQGDFILTLYEAAGGPGRPALVPQPDAAPLGQRHHLPAAGWRAGRRGAAHAVRPARGDHHFPARRVAAPGCRWRIARRSGRRWRSCTWPARGSRPCGPTGWGHTPGRRCWSAARRAPARCRRGWRPSWRRRRRASWAPGRRVCQWGTSTPICSRTTCSSSAARSPG